jgi:Ferritin-like
MSSPQITTIKELHRYLYLAMQLEHATIPPYLLALYSIHPGTNPDATHILRTVVVEEMLHLTLAANILNAVGGTPDLTTPDFVPLYPTPLPDGETDFKVDLQRFSKEAVETFLKIERPRKAPSEAARLVRRPGTQSLVSRGLRDPQLHYYSIGEFYEEIARGIYYLAETVGPAKLFTGAGAKQATAEYYYSGGGELFPVTDQETAIAAIDLISGQGEGLGGDIYDKEHELAHYYRFDQLRLGKYYQAGDQPGEPNGPALTVDWDATYPIEKNPRMKDYGDSELYAAAMAFNQSYAQFLALLTKAFKGEPQLLLDAVPQMFRLREKITQLIHNPIPRKKGVHAAPTFELAALQTEVAR